MKHFAAVDNTGVVRFMSTSTEDYNHQADDLVMIEVTPDFDPAGKRWDGASFTAHQDLTKLEAAARRDRQRYLAECDWTQGKDAPLTKAKQAEWAAYRQALRDVTDQPDFPTSISWPAPPTK